MRLRQIGLSLLVLPVAWAQQNRPAPPKSADARAPLTRSSFSAAGLSNEKVLTDFYTGNFVDIPFDRENLPFLTLFQAYLESYATRCAAYLPPNKVEMTRQECAQESYQVNQYGARTGVSTCVSYRTVGTGLYADPVLYDAKGEVDRVAALSVVKDTLKLMTQKNPLEGALNTLKETQVQANDMNRLLAQNSCTSPGVKRFQENLRLFALGKQPIPLSGSQPDHTSPRRRRSRERSELHALLGRPGPGPIEGVVHESLCKREHIQRGGHVARLGGPSGKVSRTLFVQWTEPGFSDA